jgi:hypothetical protein
MPDRRVLQVTDAGLASLDGFTSLTSLKLACFSRITAEGAISLCRLPRLASLDLGGSFRCTTEGCMRVKALSRSLQTLQCPYGFVLRECNP